jgi:serine protease Do
VKKELKMKVKLLTLAMVVSGVVATGTAGAAGWHPAVWFHKPVEAADKPAVAAPIGPITAPNYRAIVERYGPAVVGINTRGIAKTGPNGLPDALRGDDPLSKFFQSIPGLKGRMPPSDVPVRGQGSGFIVSKDGLILTNAHVVEDADEVTVKLSDRREYKAKVLGSDPASDVAVLKIDADRLPVVIFGNTGKLGVGDYVLAIGSPFGFEQSATAGIVSAKGRSLPGDGYVPYIQTDVAVNPGNSGGPLFDTSGAVVGINSQIYSRTGGYEGISFAVPIDVALRVKDQIAATGKVRHARLGVTVQDLDQSLAESFNLTQPDGALISSVLPGSAAAKAGMEPGDVVLKYNVQRIGQSGDLPALVAVAAPGDKVALEVWRAGKKVELSTMLTEATEAVAPSDANAGGPSQDKLGVAVRPLTPEERKEVSLASGLLVEQAAGPAARAGIEAGDIILAVNGASIKSIEQLQALVSKENKLLAMLIQRAGAKMFIPVKLG